MRTEQRQKEKKTAMRILKIPALFLAIVLLAGLTACFEQRYHVDYDGRKSAYTGAKDSYPAGAKVTLYYENWATDTDYSFYLDDEPLDFGWDDRRGFVIEFMMPAHDVTLRCESYNSMEYDPDAYCSNPLEAFLVIEFSRLDVDYEAEIPESGYTMQVFCPEDGKAKVLVETMEGARDLYLVDEEIIDDVFRIAEETGMRDWGGKYDSVYQDLDAYTYRSLLWLDADDAFFADSGHFPEDGEEVFDRIEERLWQDLDEAHLTEQTE